MAEGPLMEVNDRLWTCRVKVLPEVCRRDYTCYRDRIGAAGVFTNDRWGGAAPDTGAAGGI